MVNTPKLRGPWDLLAILTLTALLVVCIVFVPQNSARVVFGLPFVLFFPGYTLCAALFPRKDSLSSMERIALSIGLSLAVFPLMGLALNYMWEISLYPVLSSLAAFTSVMSGAAYYRRRQLPPQERCEPQVNVQLPSGNPLTRQDRILAALMAILVIGAVAAAVYVGTRPRSTDRFTEFYLLGSGGTVEYYPHDMILGTNADVVVGIVNHEGQEVTYRVRVTLAGNEVRVIDGIAIEDSGTWEEAVAIRPTTTGSDQKVEFLLYREGESGPYHELRLWIDVRDPDAAQ